MAFRPMMARLARGFFGLLLCGLCLPSHSRAGEDVMNAQAFAQAVAPGGTLRAAINLGNPVLAGRDAEGQPSGITVDIARELGRRIGRPVRLVPFHQAGEVADAAAKDLWDIAFLAIDPKRAEDIRFTAAYVLIEGAYAVRTDSPLQSLADIDRDGVRIAVVANSAYDLFLTRTLKHAALVRASRNEEALDNFKRQRLDAIAGVRQPLAVIVASHPDMRMIPGRFMAIEQAMGVPRAHAAAATDLRAFVEDLKASGFIAQALARHRQPDAQVAPPTP